MGTRTDVEVVDQPWPVVFDAFVRSLPTAGFRVTAVDAERGRIECRRRNRRFVVAVGAIDAITSEWIVTVEQRVGVFPERHDRQVAAIRESLEQYLGAYYA